MFPIRPFCHLTLKMLWMIWRWMWLCYSQVDRAREGEMGKFAMLRFKSFRSLRARVGNTQPLGQIWCTVCFCRIIIIIGTQICFMHIYLCIVLLPPPQRWVVAIETMWSLNKRKKGRWGGREWLTPYEKFAVPSTGWPGTEIPEGVERKPVERWK